MKTLLYAASAALALAAAPAAAQSTTQARAAAATEQKVAIYAPITIAEVQAAQRAWCNALVAISNENATRGGAAAKRLAGQVLDSAYGYDMGPVLFKPTLTVAPQTFRTTRDGALAYFVGDDRAYPKDRGFALNNWKRCESENAGIVITGNSAISMGNVSIYNDTGALTRVDKTWGYVRGPDGNLRIVLHHSSLPYTAQ
ncbi:phosphoribosyl-AMP cyclohydrolase [Qipengyuania sediminis]|uniref:phosphoribosyl-AMP cyclohydrolase n=1 Tax=Qipengyuania sediminis TaxID=1532023 RepID=UPI0010597DE6|nr:phosphoribosyl-AMP cyclohydrolase [Qipengyuania sediminis]